MSAFRRRVVRATLLLPALLLVALALGSCGAASATTSLPAAVSGDAVFAKAFSDHADGLEVQGQGTVQKLLSDDVSGERHQRFIVKLVSGQTLLIAHNIDVAHRVPGLQVGDTVAFKGEYVWNAQGGLVHWTHCDPSGSHAAGWIKYQGKTYQ